MRWNRFGSSLACTALGVFAMAQDAAAQDVIAPGSPIVAIYNTTAGGNSTASTAGTASEGQYPTNEPAPAAIDNNTATKYLNFGTGGGSSVSSATKGVGTGFYVTPTDGASVVRSFRITTANDAPARDPLAITIEGSNATGDALALGASWTLLYSGSTGIETDPGRFIAGPILGFENSTSYSSYRVLTTAQRASANSVQFSEFELYVPEPGSVGLALFASAGLLFRRRR